MVIAESQDMGRDVQIDYSAYSEVTRDDLDRLVKNAKAREKLAREYAKEAVLIAKGARATCDDVVVDMERLWTKANDAHKVSSGIAVRNAEFVEHYNQLTLLMGRIEKYMKRLSDENTALKVAVANLEEKVRKHEAILNGKS